MNDSIYWHDDAGLFVNLFVPSELDWAEKRFRLRQETRFPQSETTTLTVAAAPAEPSPLRTPNRYVSQISRAPNRGTTT